MNQSEQLAGAVASSASGGEFLSTWKLVLLIIGGLLLWDQIGYIRKKGSIAGPRFKIWPVIGPFLESVNPDFKKYQEKWRSGPLSCVSVFHKFVVIASTRDLARKVLSSPQYVKPCVVDVAIKILRPTNWVFMDGKAHVEYRKSLNPLFTRQALSVYIPQLEAIYDRYLERWLEMSKQGPQAYMPEFREINCATSLRVFCGEYISDDQIHHISDNYYRITAALELVNFPIILPFTKAWRGKQMADSVMDIFADCAEKSKHHIANGGEVTCVMDDWIKLMQESKKAQQKAAEEKSEERIRGLVRDFTNKEISETIFTFLFASQDATSSATTWLFQIIGDRPEVMAQIREEQLRVRNGNLDARLDIDMVDQMTYTNMVVREALRYRPPVSMVPYVVKRPFKVSENYTAPKGAMIIPTLHPALHDPEVYENPEEFIPERWAPGSDAEKAVSNWLVFGSGPHVCLGQRYVFLVLVSLLGKAALFYDWNHVVTSRSEVIRVFATIFPDDDCILEFKKRSNEEILASAA